MDMTGILESAVPCDLNDFDATARSRAVTAQQDTSDEFPEAFKIPDDFYWLNRFIPEHVGPTPNNSNKGGTYKLHELCDKCKEIRDWYKSHQPKDTQKFEHHGDGTVLIMSAYKGCHLCSVLIASISGGVRSRKSKCLVLGSYVVEITFPDKKGRKGVSVFSRESPLFGYVPEGHISVFEHGKISFEDQKFSEFTSSEETKDWAKSMEAQCTLSHTRCLAAQREGSDFLPTRLIELGYSECEDNLRIVSSKDLLTQCSQYIALSYCWGGNQTFKLTTSTFDELYSGFQISALPKTIRDAISIAKWFKIRYLWVDALCIIQGDADDWIQQAPLMEKVYRSSFLVIAAQGAKDTTEGCFAQRSQLVQFPCKLFERSDGTVVFFDPRRSEVNTNDRQDVLSRSALCTRAWTMQERLLCPRILYFGAMLKWECCDSIEWELPNFHYTHSENENASRYLFSDGLNGKGPDLLNLAKDWASITDMYTRSNITVASDRTVALHGIIKHMEERTGYENLAGLWRPILLPQLLWYLENNDSEAHSPGSKNFVPSWSWLGMNDEIKYGIDYSDLTYLCQLIHAEASFITQHESGTFAWTGEIHIKAYLIPNNRIDWGRVEFWPDSEVDGELPFLGASRTDLFLIPVATNFKKDWPSLILPRGWIYGLVVCLLTNSTRSYERLGYFELVTKTGVVPRSELGQEVIILV